MKGGDSQVSSKITEIKQLNSKGEYVSNAIGCEVENVNMGDGNSLKDVLSVTEMRQAAFEGDFWKETTITQSYLNVSTTVYANSIDVSEIISVYSNCSFIPMVMFNSDTIALNNQLKLNVLDYVSLDTTTGQLTIYALSKEVQTKEIELSGIVYIIVVPQTIIGSSSEFDGSTNMSAWSGSSSGGSLSSDFISKTTTFNDDGSITETDSDNNTKTTVFNTDGSITETITDSSGVVTAIKTTSFNDNIITESVT